MICFWHWFEIFHSDISFPPPYVPSHTTALGLIDVSGPVDSPPGNGTYALLGSVCAGAAELGTSLYLTQRLPPPQETWPPPLPPPNPCLCSSCCPPPPALLSSAGCAGRGTAQGVHLSCSSGGTSTFLNIQRGAAADYYRFVRCTSFSTALAGLYSPFHAVT